MDIVVKATKRDVQGTGASRRLRRASKVPAIVYGGGKDASLIELDHNETFFNLKKEAFHASILTLEVDGAKERVLLRDVQMHPWRQIVAHLDFQRVSKDRKIHMKVPLHFVGDDVAPGVKLQGGAIQHVMNELDIQCLPDDLPEFIQVDVSNLTAGHSLHVAELALPKGVELTPSVKKENPSVATIIMPKAAVEEEEAAPAVAAAEVPTTAQKAPAEKEAAAKPEEKGGKKEEKKK